MTQQPSVDTDTGIDIIVRLASLEGRPADERERTVQRWTPQERQKTAQG